MNAHFSKVGYLLGPLIILTIFISAINMLNMVLKHNFISFTAARDYQPPVNCGDCLKHNLYLAKVMPVSSPQVHAKLSGNKEFLASLGSSSWFKNF